MSHTALYRFNALGTYVIVLLAALVAAASFTDVTHRCSLQNASASIVGIERFIRAPAGFGDEAVFALDLDVDLASCFSWNTKLVFASVTVGYETEERDHNEATVWDRVARDASEAGGAKTKGRVMAKYKLRSVDEDLRGKEMTVRVRWAVTPRAGRLWREGRRRRGLPCRPSTWRRGRRNRRRQRNEQRRRRRRRRRRVGVRMFACRECRDLFVRACLGRFRSSNSNR